MSEDAAGGFNRRELLGLSAAALATLMIEASLPARAAAAGESAKSDPRFAFTDRVSDLVIPATDTPGASTAGTATFVLMALDHRMSDLDPQMLTRLRSALDTAAGGDFLRQPLAQQRQLLAAHDAAAYAKSRAAPGTAAHDWQRLKTAIIAGYYTSEIGASKELTYLPVPGEFHNIRVTPEFRNPSIDGFGGAL
ncbi:MAG: gluconate 2-dehydrogenase subunit 3 family protein [Steroidobacteraceae bacterium]